MRKEDTKVLMFRKVSSAACSKLVALILTEPASQDGSYCRTITAETFPLPYEVSGISGDSGSAQPTEFVKASVPAKAEEYDRFVRFFQVMLGWKVRVVKIVPSWTWEHRKAVAEARRQQCVAIYQENRHLFPGTGKYKKDSVPVTV